MSTAAKLIKNGLLMSAASLIIQVAAMGFNVYMSNKIGAEGMGLFSLVSSVYRFAITFSLSGIGFAATRMAAEEFAKNSGKGALDAVKRCALYALIFSSAAAFGMYASAETVSVKFLGDIRCVLSIKILALSLPFLSVSSAFDGYFTAKRSIKKNASSLIIEQTVRMFSAVMLLELFVPSGVEYACAAVSLGIVMSEGVSFFYMLFSCLHSGAKEKGSLPSRRGQTSRMLSIAVPIALSSYLRSGLSTMREVLIPSGLEKYGGSYEQALASYGVIQGMTMPILYFPAVFLNSFSGLLMPEMARYYQQGYKVSIRNAAERVIRITLLFSLGAAALLTAFSNELGMLFYSSREVGRYLLILAPLVIVMYLDTAVDSMLKGINEQLANVRYNVLDSGLTLILVATLLPKFGITGYIAVIFISEIFNITLSLRRLIKVTGLKINITGWIVMPASCAAAAMLISRLPLSFAETGEPSVILTLISAVIGIAVYCALLRVSGSVTAEDISTATEALSKNAA